MRDAGRRPIGRLCYWVMAVVLTWGLRVVAQSGPATTTVADTVYLADGTHAQGSLIITWPAFLTSGGSAVAAGTTNTTLGANGALSVALIPNVAATPAGVYYTVVYQLGPGEVKTEYWLVPTTSPANLAAVRTTPGSGIAGSPVSIQYVNSELATKANDNAVLHLAGTETISGAKTFSAAPNVPAPTSTGQVTNKAYVDQSVSNAGAGVFLPTAGGTMTGPITLPGSPAAAMQAATKQYVDTGAAAKADVISGLVPASELGTGVAASGSCLLGNGASGTWGTCGGGGGTGNLSTNPVANQTISQPVGTQFSTNNLANIRYVTSSWNWAQTPADNLATAGNVTIHLSPCPMGVDTASGSNFYTYKVYIAGTGTAEAVLVTGGSCTPGAASGTIAVTTTYGHGAGYSVGSASTGIQEAWNDAWVNDIPVSAASAAAPYVKLVAGTQYNIYATVYLRGRGGVFDGAGGLLGCYTRDRCIQIGGNNGHPGGSYTKVYNLTAGPGLSTGIDGAQVASVSASSGTYTITTAAAHNFVVGDTVDCEYYSQNAMQHWVAQAVSPTSGTTLTVSLGSGSFSASANTFGFCGLLNAFIENNSGHVDMRAINISQFNSVSPSNNAVFTYGIVNDNDQQFQIDHFANRGSSVILSTPNFPMGAAIYQRSDQGMAGIIYLHNSEISNVNCGTSGGNGFEVDNTVCQAFPVFGFRYFGGLQPSSFQNVYQESSGSIINPLYGTGLATGGGAAMAYLFQGGTGHTVIGMFPVAGIPPTFPCPNGTGGGQTRNYFVVPRASAIGATYGPVVYAGSAVNCSGNIVVTWPSVQLQDVTGTSVGSLTWDVLVTTGTSTPPFGMGSFGIATNVSGACGSNGMCSFTDTQAAAVPYTVQTQVYGPKFWFWPASFVINNTVVHMDQASNATAAVASQGIGGVSIEAMQCRQLGIHPEQRTPILVSCINSEQASGAGLTSTLLQQLDPVGTGPLANSKGRINFGGQINVPNDILTLQDSNFAKTAATSGERPSNDAGDMAIGVDQTGGLSERAATSITSYINAVPSGSNFQERLTAAGKTFNVPVTVNGNLGVTSGTVTLPVTGTGSQCLHVSATGALSGTGADCAVGTVNSGVASQVAMYSGSGAAVNGDATLSDNGTTLNYTGSGGISATAGLFTGNLTVNGQLLVAGPWMVSSPIPGTPMGPAGAGTSALGISNDGNFYISANGGTPQKVATSATSSYFSNLFQEDANDLGEYNGTNPQGLHVYSSYTNSSTWQRTSLGFDTTDNLAVVRSENSTSGSAPGLGFWIGSSVRWAIDSTSTLKPFLNNSINIGTTTLAPQTVYAATSFDTLTAGRQNFELCNDSTSGTSLNFLAVYNGSTPACAVKAAASSTDGVIGIVSNGSGTSGNAVITYRGYVQCSFDGSTVAGDFVVASTSNAGDCHDAGATRPTGVQVLGRVESTNTGVGTYGIRAAMESPLGVGAVTSVFGRTGAVTAQSGDYSVGQITGAAPAASATLTGTPTAPTAAASTNTTQIATTAFAHGVTPPDSSATVWMTVPHASSSGTVFSSGANKAAFFGVMLGYQKSTSQVGYYVATADTSSTTYDLGIYSGTSAGTCTLMAHTGSIAGSTAMTSGSHTVSWTGGSVTLQPGRYYLALTASATSSTAVLYGDSAGVTFAGGTGTSNVGNVSVTSGGTLPASVTCPTDSVQVAALIPAWLVE